MPLRIENYRVKVDDDLADPDFWFRRFADIDLRLAQLESLSGVWDTTVETLLATALARINDSFMPLVLDAQQRLNQLGASFNAESLTSVTMATGPITLTLTEESAANYVYTDYVTCKSATDETKKMLGSVTSFTRETGVLMLNIVQLEGSGTFAHWLLRVGAPPDIAHAGRTDNPHATTAAQVGAYTTAQTDAAIAAQAPAAVEDTLQDAVDAAVASLAGSLGALAYKALIGFGDIGSSTIATQVEAEAGTANNKLMTPLRVAQALAGSIQPPLLLASVAELLAGNAERQRRRTCSTIRRLILAYRMPPRLIGI